MFFSTEILTKRGPLARVWMASHLSTKLTKSNLLSTSIPASVGSILGQELLPMALRLSGQLLLGVARIYSRKTKYLLDDCNETLVRVKRAFKPGQVDMEDGEIGRNKEAVTLRAENGGLDDILNYDAGNYWDMDFAAPQAGPSKVTGKANTSALADITLPDHSLARFADYEVAEFDYGEGGPIGGDDFELDLGLMEDEVEMGVGKGKKRARNPDSDDDDDMSVEAGRDAMGSQAHASARGSSVGAYGFDQDDAPAYNKENNAQIGGEQIDLGLDGYGDYGAGAAQGGEGGMDFDFQDYGADYGAEARQATPQQDDANMDQESMGLTPRTAANLVAKNAERAIKKQKLRKQVVDREIELEWKAAKKNELKEHLFTEPQYLPRSRLHLRLLELASSPTSHNLPQPVPNTPSFFSAAPSGLAPEIAALFKFPTRRSQYAAEEEDQEVEIGRKRGREASYEPAFNDDYGYEGEMGGGELGGPGYDDEGVDMGMDAFQFDVDNVVGGADQQEQGTPVGKASGSQRQKKQKLAGAHESVYGSGGGASYYFDEDAVRTESMGPLAVFDDTRSSSATQANTQSQMGAGTMSQSLGEEEEEALAEGGAPNGKWSKNTMKALGVLRVELKGDEEKEIELEVVAKDATRRAAAAFFFELLVLGTRDCVQVQQEQAFGSIKIQARPKLWEGLVDEVEAF